MHCEKAKWELHKKAKCCSERILEATPYKTVAVRPLAAYLANHSSKIDKTFGAQLEK